MRAAVVRSFDSPPRCEEFLRPAPSAGHELVKVLAAAVHPRTRSGASGSHYTSSGQLPLVPGIDGVGICADGTRVYFVAADDAHGSLAEYTLADRAQCVPLPADASSEAVAAAVIPAISSWVALTKRVIMRPGQSVLILGATGVAGRLAVQIAKKLGAGAIIAAGRTSAGIAQASALGASATVPLSGREEDGRAVAQVASEVDIVLDYLWGEVAQVVMPQLLRRRQDEQRRLYWIEIGALAGDEVKVPSVLLRKRDVHLLGSGQGSARIEDMLGCVPAIAQALATGDLRVDTRQAPLAEIETLWNAPMDKGQRLVFVP